MKENWNDLVWNANFYVFFFGGRKACKNKQISITVQKFQKNDVDSRSIFSKPWSSQFQQIMATHAIATTNG